MTAIAKQYIEDYEALAKYIDETDGFRNNPIVANVTLHETDNDLLDQFEKMEPNTKSVLRKLLKKSYAPEVACLLAPKRTTGFNKECNVSAKFVRDLAKMLKSTGANTDQFEKGIFEPIHFGRADYENMGDFMKYYSNIGTRSSMASRMKKWINDPEGVKAFDEAYKAI